MTSTSGKETHSSGSQKSADKDHIVGTDVQTLTHTTGAVNNGGEKITKGAPAVQTHVQGSKADITHRIFNEEAAKATSEGRQLVRRDVIDRFVKEGGMSQAGAATYYQGFKTKAGGVSQRVIVQHEIVPVGNVTSNNSSTRPAPATA